MIGWVTAARRRMRDTDRTDAGFLLPYVLLVTFLIMSGTALMLRVVTNNIQPTVHSQDQETALAAAQAGIQAYVAELNANCSGYYTVTGTNTVQECSWPATAAASPLTSGASGAPALTTGNYSVRASNTSGFLNANQDDIRIVSIGTANTAGTKTPATVKLVADISGTPNALRFSYFTDYESTDPNFLTRYFPARSITVPGSALLTVLGIPVGQTSATVTWPGLTAASATNCGALWYNDPSNPTPAGNGRAIAGDDVMESGSLSPAVSGLTPSIDHTCSVSFSAGMTFDGPVYSHDALYVSNGLPGNTTGPSFSVPLPCAASVLTNCEPLPPASSAWSGSNSPTAPGSPYRSAAPPLGGTPTSANGTVQTVQTSRFDVTLPNSVSDAAPIATCSYSGDTALSISGSTVTATGAGSTGQPSSCLTVNVAKTTLYVTGNATIAANSNLGSGRLSIVATGDITMNGSLTTSAPLPTVLPPTGLPRNTYGEPGVSNGGNGTTPAIDLVAQGNVRIAHTVTCANGSAQAAAGYCPNDITGLYTTNQTGQVVNNDGTLKNTHPARQYCNMAGDSYPCTGGAKAGCDTGSSAPGLTIDAAVFALHGSLQTDNFNRGCALGMLTVNGGVYTNFRGPLGQEWGVPSSGAAARAYSGYKLQLNYVSLESAGLAYVPALEGGSPNHPWQVLSVSGASS